MWALYLRYIMMTVVGLLIVTSMVILLVAAFLLKGKHDLGLGFENECTDYYFEKERGDYIASQEYEKVVKTLFLISLLLLGICYLLVLLGLILMIAIYTFINWGDIGFGSPLDLTLFGKLESPKIIKIFTLIIIGIIVAALIVFKVFWILSIAQYKTYANSKIKFSVSPFANGTTPSVFLRNQLITMGITLVLTLFMYLTMFRDIETARGYSITFLIILGIVIVLIPFVSYYIHRFDSTIKSYLTKIQQVAKSPNLDNQDLLKQRRDKYHSTIPDTSIIQKNNVENGYEYLMHSKQFSNTRSIEIPGSFLNYVLPAYRSGRFLATLKERVSGFYNKRLLSGKSPIDYSTNDIDGSDFKELREYLNMKKVNDDREAFIKVINIDILKQPTTDKTAFLNSKALNPVTIQNQKDLEAIRDNKDIETTINGYYTRAKGIVYSIAFIAFYLVYHGMYSSLKDKYLHLWALFILAMILVVALIGFVFIKNSFYTVPIKPITPTVVPKPTSPSIIGGSNPPGTSVS
jgi:hypothetical protein